MIKGFVSYVRRQARLRRLLKIAKVEYTLGGATLDVEPVLPTGFGLRLAQRVHWDSVSSRGALVLDGLHTPFLLEDVDLSGAGRGFQDSGTLVFRPFESDQAGALEQDLRYTVCWPAAGPNAVAFVRIPFDLPEPFVERRGDLAAPRPAPTFDIRVDELVREYVMVFSLHEPGTTAARTSRAVAAILVRASDIAQQIETPAFSSYISHRGLEVTTPDGFVALVAAATDARKGVASIYGAEPQRELMFFAGPDRTNAEPSFGGLAIAVSPGLMLALNRPGFAAREQLVLELSSAYWGHGCRIVGPWQHELTAAISGAVSLLWAKQNASADYYEASIRRYQKLSATGRLHGAFQRANQQMDAGAVGRWSLALHRDFATASGLDRLRRLTHRFWGLLVPSHTVLREFGLSSP